MLSRFIRDKNNNVVVWQAPNLPLFGWFVFMVAARFAGSDSLAAGLGDLSRAFLFVWAYLEITQGASSFRRMVGAIVMFVVLAGYFR